MILSRQRCERRVPLDNSLLNATSNLSDRLEGPIMIDKYSRIE